MSDPMTDARLAEIAAREAKATAGPWTLDRDEPDEDYVVLSIPEISRTLHDSDWSEPEDLPRDEANADFIAHARTDVPDLLSEIARLRADGATLKVRADEAHAAHSASFGAFSTLSAALFARVQRAEGREGDAREAANRAIKMRDYWKDVAKMIGPQLFEANRRCEQLESDGATLRELVRKLRDRMEGERRWEIRGEDGVFYTPGRKMLALFYDAFPEELEGRSSYNEPPVASAPKEPTPHE